MAGCDGELLVTMLTAVSVIWNTLSSSTGVEALLFKVYLLRVPSFTDTVTTGNSPPPSSAHSSIKYWYMISYLSTALAPSGCSQVKVMEVGVVATALRLVGGGRGAVVRA
jgi:hypothetical protein